MGEQSINKTNTGRVQTSPGVYREKRNGISGGARLAHSIDSPGENPKKPGTATKNGATDEYGL